MLLHELANLFFRRLRLAGLFRRRQRRPVRKRAGRAASLAFETLEERCLPSITAYSGVPYTANTTLASVNLQPYLYTTYETPSGTVLPNLSNSNVVAGTFKFIWSDATLTWGDGTSTYVGAMAVNGYVGTVSTNGVSKTYASAGNYSITASPEWGDEFEIDSSTYGDIPVYQYFEPAATQVQLDTSSTEDEEFIPPPTGLAVGSASVGLGLAQGSNFNIGTYATGTSLVGVAVGHFISDEPVANFHATIVYNGADITGTIVAAGSYNGHAQYSVEFPTGSSAQNGPTTISAMINDGHNQITTVNNISVFSPVSVAARSFPVTDAGASYSPQTISASGGSGSYTFTSSGLPPGLTLSSAGVVSGTTNAGDLGTYAFTVTAKDTVNGTTGQASFTLTVNVAPSISTTALPAWTANSSVLYSQTIAASGGTGPLTFSVTSGSLPPGLILNPSTGVISGTPTTASGGQPYTFGITATDFIGGQSPQQTYALTINPAITFNPSSATFAIALDTPFTETIAASGGTGGVTVAYTLTSGTIPQGLTLSANGAALSISGTPTATGTFTFSVTGTDGIGAAATNSYTLAVSAAPNITSVSGTTFTVGAASSFTATAIGFPAPTFTETGALPGGVTLTSAGLLSGTPAAGTGGSYPIVITATNGVSPDATQSFTLTVNQAPAITSLNGATLTVGTAGSFAVTASGYPSSITFTETGALPSGVTLSSTGVLGGTPAAGTGGTYPIVITANNGISPNATQSFSLTIDQAPAITSVNGATFTVGTAGSFTVSASGYPTSTFTETGVLPSGVTLTAAGVLSGTPAAGTGGTYPIVITATNGTSPNATQTYTLTVNQAPAITSSSGTTFTAGTAGSFTVAASGYPIPTTFTETGALPSGVTLSSAGVLGGTPAAGTGGTYPIVITATNGISPSATQSFSLTVNQAPAITSLNSTTFTVGTSGSFAVTASGYPTPTFTESGLLPSGVMLTSAGVLSGTPAAGTGGAYPIVITATNGTFPIATQSLTLTVNQAPAITSLNGTTFTAGTAGTFALTTSGYPTAAFTETGALPSGVTLTAAGVLSGTPAAGTGGTYPIVITATNGTSPNATQSFTLTVNQAPAITSLNGAAFAVSTADTFAVTASGYPTPTFTETGALPSGVTLTSAGVLSGTPAAGTSGTYPIVITATNGISPNATQSFSLTVSPAPAITSLNSTTFTVGTAGSFAVTSSENPAPTFTETGALPSGVTLTSAGVLSGTPAAGTGGVYPIVITATNGVSPNATQSFTLTVNQAPAITSLNGAAFAVGAAGSFTVTSSGYPTPTFSETGNLPSGVTLSSAGVLSGAPGAGTGGVYSIVITAANGTSPNATQPFTLTVNQAPAIISVNSTTFTVGSAFSFAVTASGYPTPTFTKTGTLPSGVTLTAAGLLSGTPAAGTGGVYPIVITATNGASPNATQSFTLTVNQAPAITSLNSTSFAVGTAGSFAVTAGGYPTPTFTKAGTLPSGVTLTAAGVLSGTPAAGTGGVYPIVITATNGVSPNATQSFTLTVNQAPAITSLNGTSFTVGTAGSFTVTSSGYPTPTFTETGTLPSGVTLTAAGVLSGTPGAGTGGIYSIVITATNGTSPNTTQSFSLTVNQAPAIISVSSTAFTVGTFASFAVTASGYPTPTFTKTGTLPSGVTLTAAGVLSGTPAAGTSGVYPIVITATNGASPNATQSFTLTVNQAPAITSVSSTTFTVGTAGSFAVTASGYPTPTFTKTGTLPSGVTLTAAGVLSGTPAAGTGGSYPLVITASNGTSPNATQSFTLTVNQAPTYGDSLDGSGNLTITQEVAAANDNLKVSLAGGNYTITDTNGLLFDTPAGADAGDVSGGGASTITIPNSDVSTISVVLGTGVNVFTFTGSSAAMDPVNVNTGITAGDQIVITGAVSDSGAITFKSNVISESGAGALSTTGTLTTSSVAGTTLGGANAVATLSAANASSGNVTLVNAAALSVAGITEGGSGSVSVWSNGTATALTVNGGITSATGGIALQGTGGITLNAALTSSGGTITLNPGSAGVGVPKTGTDVSDATGTLAFASGANLNIAVNGTTAGSQYNQLNVTGIANLSGVNLVLSGTFTSQLGNVFTIVSATSVSGTFNGLANGSTIPWNGRLWQIAYKTGSVTLTDVAGPANSFVVSAPATATAGTSFNVTLTAMDSYGNVATGYTGTVHFSSSDGAATLPADYTFTAGDAGVHTLAVTLNTAGSQSLTMIDNANGALKATAVGITVSASGSLNPSVAPSGNFNLSNWNLTLPTGKTNDPAVISTSALNAGYTSTYFYTGADGAMIFWAPVNGVTTSGSSYARSELRETNADGSLDNWNAATGTATMNATLAVNQVPSDGNVIIAQIHDNGAGGITDNPLIKLEYEYNSTTGTGSLVAGVRSTPTSSDSNNYTVATNIPLNTQFTYQIQLKANLTLSLQINGVTKYSSTISSSWDSQGLYFKAGAYVQDNVGPSTEGARVSFYALTTSHT